MSKNANGTGSISYNKKQKKWIGEVVWTDSDGTRHKKSFSSTQKVGGKTIVRTKLDGFIQSLNDRLEHRGGGSPFFADVAEKWLDEEKMYLKPLSFQRKKSTYENHVSPAFDNIPIEEISHDDIQELINKMHREGFSYSSMKKVYEAINSCIRYYRNKRQTYFNPCENIRIPSVNKKDISDIEYFNGAQIKKIEEESKRTYSSGKRVYRLGSAIIAILYTGMRVGELLALEWNDIDFKNNTISITKDAVLVRNEDKYEMVIQKTPKTQKSYRVIPMIQKSRDAFLDIKSITGTGKYVMTTAEGNIVRPYNIDKMFVKMLKHTDIIDEGDSYGVHTLRHTFASLLFNNGTELKVVSEVLGHSSLKVTGDIYVHLIQKQKAKALERLNNINLDDI